MKLHGAGASADSEAAEEFCKILQKKVEDENWDVRQIWNCDETGLFWKKSPNTTYIPVSFANSATHGFKVDKKESHYCLAEMWLTKSSPLYLLTRTKNPAASKAKTQKA